MSKNGRRSHGQVWPCQDRPERLSRVHLCPAHEHLVGIDLIITPGAVQRMSCGHRQIISGPIKGLPMTRALGTPDQEVPTTAMTTGPNCEVVTQSCRFYAGI